MVAKRTSKPLKRYLLTKGKQNRYSASNKDTNTVVNDGSTVSLNEIANGFTPDSLLTAIKKHYAWKTSDQSNDNIEMTTTASDVESQLVAQDLKRASNGSFEYPANGFC